MSSALLVEIKTVPWTPPEEEGPTRWLWMLLPWVTGWGAVFFLVSGWRNPLYLIRGCCEGNPGGPCLSPARLVTAVPSQCMVHNWSLWPT